MKRLALAILLSSVVSLSAQEEPKKRVGKYEVSLRLKQELYAQEESEIEFRIVNAEEVDPVTGPSPLIRALIHSTVTMPSMPGMPEVKEIAHPEGIPGEYGIHPTFAHGGEFLVRLEVKPPVGEPFTVEFPLQVADQPQGKSKRKVKPVPYYVEVKAQPSTPKAGQPAVLDFVVKHREKNERVTKFDIAHEKYLHLLVVREDLGSFAHEHPEPQPDGSFRFNYAFPAGGRYHLFADVAPAGAGSQILLTKLKADGKPGPPFKITAVPTAQHGAVNSQGPMRITLRRPAQPWPAGKTSVLEFDVLDQDGRRPVTDIQPYLGALGHLMLIHEDGATFVHSHPDERDPNAGKGGPIPFMARFPKPGLYRGWVQFQRGGTVWTSDFVLGIPAN